MKRRPRSKRPQFNQPKSYFFTDKDSEATVRLWALRMVVTLGGHKELHSRGYIQKENLARFLGLEEYVESEDDFDPKDLIRDLRYLLAEAEKSAKKTALPKTMASNIKKIVSAIGLNAIEEKLLQFIVILKYESIMDEASDTLEQLTTAQAFQAISVILDIPLPDIKQALACKSKLQASGVITVDRNGSNYLVNMFDLLSRDFPDRIMNDNEEVHDLIKECIRKSSPGTLKISDFAHVQEHLDLLIPYMKQGIKTSKKGINILIYGTPGTGKTELTKALASELGCELFEVSYADDEDEPMEGLNRFKAYKVAQNFLTQKRVVLMFDEIEDVFHNDANPFSTRQKNKGWVNWMLEENRIPTIWLSNSIRLMDKATLRRFDMAIEMSVPPKMKRIEIIQNSCRGLLSQESIEILANHEKLAPAVVTRAADVIHSINGNVQNHSKAVEMLVESTLKAQGFKGFNQNNPHALPSVYDPDYVNCKVDLVAIAHGIKSNPNARICLYGPPGTGKSAFGKWLADKLDRPLHLKKGSDLLSMWVGGTEQNIARAFEEAREEDAVLVLDEVDSFLQDRRNASRSWEVTEVNEMLTQMESFEGVFIATTNLIDGLDQASIRRFDLKLEFGYMKPDQAWDLFTHECKSQNLKKPPVALKQQLNRIKNITPGDFAAIARRNRFNPINQPAELLERLAQECRLKNEESGVSLGFL